MSSLTNAEMRQRVAEIKLEFERRANADSGVEVEALKAEHASLQAQLDAVVYPILSVPPEVTAYIFKWVCAIGGHRGIAPLTLLRVCRDWRSIAIGTPSVWTLLRFDKVPQPLWPAEKVQALLDLFLSRAGAIPMDAQLPVCSSGIFDIIRQNAARFESLELTPPRLTFNAAILRHPFELSHLASLTLTPSLVIVIGVLPIRTFSDAPKLRCLTLNHQVQLLDIILPWQQLTRFTGESYTTKMCLDAFRMMPNLISCDFAVPASYSIYDDPAVFDIAPPPDLLSVVYLESLRLRLDSTQKNAQLAIFGLVRCPVLR
ncbi:F-box domain-containing protein [Mycena kentingensis (nom. inval.)]|nr:F-box domain-containing protein [Mycena kentingensis (nom. inval.)]